MAKIYWHPHRKAYWVKLNWGQLVAAVCGDIEAADFVARQSVIDIAEEVTMYTIFVRPEPSTFGPLDR